MSTESNIAATVSGGISLTTILTYREELTLFLGVIAMVISIMTFFVNWYYQAQRNKRELVLFEERRLGIAKDTGKRRRATDE